jgi:hypothetical protein
VLVSGAAWHWVEPATGAAKAAAVLKPGGRIGVFWNHAVREAEMTGALRRVYGLHSPQLLEAPSVVLGSMQYGTMSGPDADALQSVGAFEEIDPAFLQLDMPLHGGVLVDELSTHSDHRFRDVNARDALFEDLRTELPKVGLSFPVRYHTGLLTAVRH